MDPIPIRWYRDKSLYPLTLAASLFTACISRPPSLNMIGGTVTGLVGTGLVLQLNGSDDLPVPANATSFRFSSLVPDGSHYAVTVLKQPLDAGQTCSVKNGFGTGAGGEITDVIVTCPTLSSPLDQTVYAGQTASFNVMASGDGPFTYQWRENGKEIAGATTDSYTTPPTTQADNGAQYNVLVQDGLGGTVTSESATLSVNTWSRFVATTSMTTKRFWHTATLLLNGQVLIAGGMTGSYSGYQASAELYDPASGTFTATGSMTTARVWHTATLLPSGRVLMVGGNDGSNVLESAELYDPQTGIFTATGNLTTTREQHAATLLPNGTVLITGGINGAPGLDSSYLLSAELYDPASGTFTATGSMTDTRQMHSATLLPNGKVLITGGSHGVDTAHVLRSAELYDPAPGTFTATGSMAIVRCGHLAMLLPDGQVLIIAGSNGAYLSSAELYSPSSGTFTATGNLATARADHTATLLPNGQVHVAGGGNGGYLSSTELYSSSSGTFGAAGNLTTARESHTATLLPNGQVLIVGGDNGSGVLSSAELFQ